MDPNLSSATTPRAPYPAPPPLWKHFTTSNAERLKELESSKSGNSSSTVKTSKASLPLELTYLIPPPPPTSDYHTFSILQPLITTTTPLPPPELLLFDPSRPLNHAGLLLKLTKSLLLNFLELITVLGENPNEGTEKIDDIRRIVVNVHAVINMYRPHQAREGVREMLEDLLERGAEEMKAAQEAKAKVEEFLRDVDAQGGLAGEKQGKFINGVSDVGKDGQEKDDVQEARRIWEAIRAIAGE